MAEFRPDGCTRFPDGNWRRCCTLHDAIYWWRPKGVPKGEADKAMQNCVTCRGGPGPSLIAAIGLLIFAWRYWFRGRRGEPGKEPQVLTWWLANRENPDWKEMPDDNDCYPTV